MIEHQNLPTLATSNPASWPLPCDGCGIFHHPWESNSWRFTIFYNRYIHGWWSTKHPCFPCVYSMYSIFHGIHIDHTSMFSSNDDQPLAFKDFFGPFSQTLTYFCYPVAKCPKLLSRKLYDQQWMPHHCLQRHPKGWFDRPTAVYGPCIPEMAMFELD